MGFNCGIVGLPNVGKSTLYNALTATQAAPAANSPFCTIDPTVGRVAVPDPRLETLAKVEKSAKIVPTQLEFVDIAGLVKGASKGEGLGNQFLGNIREVDAIAQVLRCFEDSDVTHVAGQIDPVRDAEIIETELMLADLESVEKRLPNLQKKAKSGDKDAGFEAAIMERIVDALRDGKPARTVAFSSEELPTVRRMQLLTSKPVLYVCNVLEKDAKSGNQYTARAAEMAKAEGAERVFVHGILDGRDVHPRTADVYAEAVEIKMADIGIGKLATLCGRYYAMDREANWERTARVYTMLVHAEGERALDAVSAIRGSFLRGITD